jgi:hypothetical protein
MGGFRFDTLARSLAKWNYPARSAASIFPPLRPYVVALIGRALTA